MSLYIAGWVWYLFLLIIETRWPAVPSPKWRSKRWGVNVVALLIVSTVFGLVTFSPTFAALWAGENNFGILNGYNISAFPMLVLTFLVRSLVGYVGHYLNHSNRILWRFHVAHHSDPFMDVTTAGRFHFIDSLFAIVIDSIIVGLLGLEFWAVFTFDVIWRFWNSFSHANINLPHWLERPLSWFIHTPSTHRAHHSFQKDELNKNYGVLLSLWDRLFGTYLANPKDQKTFVAGSSMVSFEESFKFKKILMTGFSINRKY